MKGVSDRYQEFLGLVLVSQDKLKTKNYRLPAMYGLFFFQYVVFQL